MSAADPISPTTELDEPRAHVAEQFEDAEQQRQTATLGMWTFLATEILFFGALFVGYAFYRLRWPEAFLHGSRELKWYLGGINTAVLLASSYAMVLAVDAASHGNNRRLIRNLVWVIVLALVFMVIKAAEYTIEYRDHLIPGLDFSVINPHEPGAPPRPTQLYLFMSFYFIMTGIHALHVIIGVAVMAALIVLARRGKFNRHYYNPVDMAGLYWHFVDVVWVFLFPSLYLLRFP